MANLNRRTWIVGGFTLTLSGAAVGLIATAPSSLEAAAEMKVEIATSEIAAENAESNAEAGGESDQYPSPMEVAVTLHRCGLGPEALAAAGATPQMLAPLIVTMREAFIPVEEDLASLDLGHANARSQVQQLQRLIRSGQGNDEDVTRLQEMMAMCGQIEGACGDLLNELTAVSSTGLPDDVVSRLRAIKQNAHWKLPTPYLVIDREERDWVAIRNWLAIERIASKNDEETPNGVAASLEEVRSHPLVSEALENYESRLTPISAAWNSISGVD